MRKSSTVKPSTVLSAAVLAVALSLGGVAQPAVGEVGIVKQETALELAREAAETAAGEAWAKKAQDVEQKLVNAAETTKQSEGAGQLLAQHQHNLVREEAEALLKDLSAYAAKRRETDRQIPELIARDDATLSDEQATDLAGWVEVVKRDRLRAEEARNSLQYAIWVDLSEGNRAIMEKGRQLAVAIDRGEKVEHKEVQHTAVALKKYADDRSAALKRFEAVIEDGTVARSDKELAEMKIFREQVAGQSVGASTTYEKLRRYLDDEPSAGVGAPERSS
ncbi:hypothetical protein JKI95_08605 [Corynebacterium aquatimens]|uniref:hypothetical protein n=2 Tax=Corynebacterium TaxID=1716 RepID=UPI0025410195|nr:hypothetical protein [Corynebacterium aquatimens]QYH19249.1 hypothetical protein JKI95_08605 [Corynebacterium aquatimens]